MRAPYSKTIFETKDWEREEHFHFFRYFTQPFFNVHTEIDITNLYHYAKWERLSFFLAYLHAATEGAQNTQNFLLRIEGNKVVKYEAADISTTVLKDNKTVSFVHLPYHPNLHTFCQQASEIVAEVKKGNQLFSGYNGPDLIHATTLPWFKFNGMEHAHAQDPMDSVPKLAFGQLEWRDTRAILPISVRLHHALADGYHVHLFLESMKASIEAIGKNSYAGAPLEKRRPLKTYIRHLGKDLFSNRLFKDKR